MNPEQIERLCVAWATLDIIARAHGTLQEGYDAGRRQALVELAKAAYQVLADNFLSDFEWPRAYPGSTEDLDEYLQGNLACIDIGNGTPLPILLSDTGVGWSSAEYTADFQPAWAKVREGMYLPGIDPHQLNCDCTARQAQSVEGWSPHYDDDEPQPSAAGAQQYELVPPKSLCLDAADIENMTGDRCVEWLRDHAFEKLADLLVESRPKGDDGATDWEIAAQDHVTDHMADVRDDWEQSSEPVMNYFYPLTDKTFDEEDAEKIAGLPPVLVKLWPQETYALVLTGGGMDLLDGIVEAHVRLGFYPPSWLRLPYMGQTLGRRERTLIVAVRESCNIHRRWLQHALDDTLRFVLRCAAKRDSEIAD